MFYRPVVQRCRVSVSLAKTYSSPKELRHILHRPVNLSHLPTRNLILSPFFSLLLLFFCPLQHYQLTIQALQDELRIQRDLNQLLQSDYSESGFLGSQSVSPQDMTEENFLRLHGEYERQVKELFLLRKTVEEMELRIDTQKHTLTAR